MTISTPLILYTSYVTNVSTRTENIEEKADGEITSVYHIYNIIFKFYIKHYKKLVNSRLTTYLT